jgi:hypothetical protein
VVLPLRRLLRPNKFPPPQAETRPRAAVEAHKPCSRFWKFRRGRGFCVSGWQARILESLRSEQDKDLALRGALLSRTTTLWLFTFAFRILPSGCLAQAPLEPAQLPVQTSFYLICRGISKGDIRQTNALLSLWEDPGSTTLRSGIIELLLSEANKPQDKQALPAESWKNTDRWLLQRCQGSSLRRMDGVKLLL